MTTEPGTRLIRMCHVLKLNRSSFYKGAQTRKNRRLRMYSDAVTGARIATIFDDELGLYGAKRIAASLNEDMAYAPINHKKVARIIKSHGTSKALPNVADASLGLPANRGHVVELPSG